MMMMNHVKEVMVTTHTQDKGRSNVVDTYYYWIFILCLILCFTSHHVKGIQSNHLNPSSIRPQPSGTTNIEDVITHFLRTTSATRLSNYFKIQRDENENEESIRFLKSQHPVVDKTATSLFEVESTPNENDTDVTNVFTGNIDLLNSISTDYTNSSTEIYRQQRDDDDVLFVTILLAQQEAKCLEDFGGTQVKKDFVLPDDLYIPFLCPANKSSLKHLQCEQCRNLTKKPLSMDDCKNLCIHNTFWDCDWRCKFIVEHVSTQMLKYINLKKSNCENGDCDLSSFRDSISVQSKDSSSDQILASTFDTVTTRVSRFIGSVVSSSFIQFVDVFCEGVTFSGNSSISGLNQSGVKSDLPDNGSRHFVLLKTLMNTTNDGQTAKEKPIVFIVEQRELDDNGSWTGFVPIGKTVLGFNEIKVAYFSNSYQFRVTAVTSDGILSKKTTDPFKTLNGYVEQVKPPKRIFVGTHRIVSDSRLDVLICWEPPEERACFYKIVLENQESDEKPRTIRIKDQPLGVNHYWFENLQFGSRYGIRVTSRTASWKHEDESTHAKLYFVTPSCLESYDHQFSKCAPPPPRNLTSLLTLKPPLPIKEGVKDDSSKNILSLQLNWLPPMYTSNSNVIIEYIVNVIPSSVNLFHRHTYADHEFKVSSSSPLSEDSSPTPKALGPFNLAGNVTEIKIDGLNEDISYDILVSALSVKGPSVPATLTLSTKIAGETVTESHGKWIYVTIILAVAIVMASSCHLMRLFFHKRKVKLARNMYFKAMEEHDAMENDWSIIPLNEEYSPWKALHENMPKEKWDIGCGNLTLGAVIGTGAFGVVRIGTMPRKAYLEFQQKHKNPNRAIRVVEEDDGVVETVAVKMLKVSATMNDRDALIKEIVTMQNLGCHSQIVTHLGACTIGKSLCLVLEYCPGGDLLTFLRKVRQKYWPLLNIDFKSKSSHSLSSSNGPSTSKSSQISYADLGSFSDDMAEKPLETTVLDGNTVSYFQDASSRPQGGIMPIAISTEDPSSDMCRPIDEMDILSYARQIALGMAYLERNRVVHRDLACRNVLVMGDYKKVKISDFGLSRDVYTSKVYHQKTNGKLPIKWMAIESIFSYCFTSKSDVWGFGIILWELVTLGGNPYPAIGNSELFHLLKSGYRMERPENCSEELYALMRKCWRSSPTDRPNFTELHQHLETMMEAAEPTMYLSLRTDVPMDYSLNSRSDLQQVEFELQSTSISNTLSTMRSQWLKGDTIHNPYYNNDNGDIPMTVQLSPSSSLEIDKSQQPVLNEHAQNTNNLQLQRKQCVKTVSQSSAQSNSNLNKNNIHRHRIHMQQPLKNKDTSCDDTNDRKKRNENRNVIHSDTLNFDNDVKKRTLDFENDNYCVPNTLSNDQNREQIQRNLETRGNYLTRIRTRTQSRLGFLFP